jgi:hypothetical protein
MTRYFATAPINVNGQRFDAGQELVGVREKNLEPMLAMGQAKAEDLPAKPAKGKPDAKGKAE